MRLRPPLRQQGLSLLGFIFVLALLGMIGVLAIKVTPTMTEYFSIKRAINNAKTAGSTVREIQAAFDRQTSAGYIDALTGKDLEITKDGDNIEISFAYQKKIPLGGPVSLLIDYAGSTASHPEKKSKE